MSAVAGALVAAAGALGAAAAVVGAAAGAEVADVAGADVGVWAGVDWQAPASNATSTSRLRGTASLASFDTCISFL